MRAVLRCFNNLLIRAEYTRGCCLWSGWQAWEVTLPHAEAEGGCLGLNLSILRVPTRFLSRSSVEQQVCRVQACRPSAVTQ